MHQEITKIKEQASNHSYTKFIKAVRKNVQLTSLTIPISLLFFPPIKYILTNIHKPSFSNY